jgi:polysaccharide chain length determinant protein (PEP-CTERM system associated)
MNKPAIKVTPELVMDTIFRRRWMIIIPLALSLVVGIYLALTTPRTYEAMTFILVEPQRVPEAFVRSIVTADPSERIGTIAQQILSRSNLEKIIHDYRLFSEPSQANMFMEDKIGVLRKQINIEVVRDRRGRGGGDAFSISFKGKDPELVTRVTNALAASFINANLMVRESHAVGTSEFLDAEMEAMRVRLEQLEGNIEIYRRTYMGELPEQLDTNLRILDRLQNSLAARQQSLRDARVRLSDLTTYARNPSVVVIGGDRRDGSTASLQELQEELDALRARYTERHPDIQRMIRMIADLEAKEAARIAADDGAESVANIPIELRAQVNEINREIETLQTDIRDIQAQIAIYEVRIENTPKREQELLGLRRDYENIRSSYNSLLSRKIESDIALNMERKQKGEQFRIVDRAQVPKRPVAPDLQKMFMITLLVGFALGGGLAFLFEFVIQPSFRKPHEIEEAFGLPVMTAIPLILGRQQIFRQWCNKVASIVMVVVTAGLIAVFGVIALQGTETVIGMLNKASIVL